MNAASDAVWCPHCGSDKRQTKAGRTKYHSVPWHCVVCDKDYTPQPKQPGYDASTRQQALALRGLDKAIRHQYNRGYSIRCCVSYVVVPEHTP